MEHQIVVDPHLLSGKKEIWILQFKHHVFTPNHAVYKTNEKIDERERIAITLEAHCDRNYIDVARMSFLPGKRPQNVIMQSYSDTEDIVEAMIRQGIAKKVGERIERHQDYPGADEIEEFQYKKLDVTDFYNGYMKMGQEEMMKSPFSHISLCDNETVYGKNPRDYVKCRIGGIAQKREWAGVDGRELTKVAKFYPDCGFHLHEMAQKIFSKQLERWRVAQERVTDVQTRIYKGMHFIRCKIDGEQQMSREVSRLDICDYQRNKDEYALVAKYYGSELDVQQGQRQTMKR